jgi:hypothetical protein
MRHAAHSLLIACALLAIFSTPAPAQPFTLDQKIKPTELALQPYRDGGSGKADGRVYGATITQTQPTQYFFVKGISIYSPDYVGVTASDPSSDLKVTLHKETWDQSSMGGQTGSTGHWNAKFRTSSDFGIRVVSDKLPATYALLVWTGNEVEATAPSPFSGSSAGTSGAQSSTDIKLYVVIGVLVLGLLMTILLKRKPRVALVIGPFLLLPIVRPVFAQEGAYPKAVAEMLEQLKSFLEHQESVKDFYESLKALSSNEALPDETQRGPSIPSSCVDPAWKVAPEDRAIGSSKYQNCQCMATAVDKLRKNRQMLEKLRIYVANQKVFVDKATALGNSYAQLHTLLGLQWVGIRKHDIDEPYAEFKTIANTKHQQVMGAIQKDLRDISACEVKFGDADWYDKYGFVYYEFLYSAYKPSF